MAFDQITANVIGEIRQMAAQLEQLHRENTRMRNALRQIADMDPEGQRADDLGRAARVAREAQRPDGVAPSQGQRCNVVPALSASEWLRSHELSHEAGFRVDLSACQAANILRDLLGADGVDVPRGGSPS